MAVVALLLQSARGGIFPDGTPDAPHVAAGLNFQGGVLYLKAFVQGYPTPAYVSATYLDSYNVLFTAHTLNAASAPITFTVVGN